MWQTIARIILRNRIAILIAIGVITVAMGFMATQVKIRYDFAALLPTTDSTLINYKAFKQQFGEDGDVLVIGLEQPELFTETRYKAWYELGEEIGNLEGIDEVLSAARCYHLVRNDSLKRFDFKMLSAGLPASQAELDSIKQEIIDLKFYDNLLWDDETGIAVMAITMNAKVLDSKKRVGLTNLIINTGKKYEDRLGANLRYSGMPYIRSLLAKVVESEMFLFIVYAILVTAFIMFAFFRSFKVVMVAMAVVAIGSLWSIGFIGIMGFRLSILTGLVATTHHRHWSCELHLPTEQIPYGIPVARKQDKGASARGTKSGESHTFDQRHNRCWFCHIHSGRKLRNARIRGSCGHLHHVHFCFVVAASSHHFQLSERTESAPRKALGAQAIASICLENC